MSHVAVSAVSRRIDFCLLEFYCADFLSTSHLSSWRTIAEQKGNNYYFQSCQLLDAGSLTNEVERTNQISNAFFEPFVLCISVWGKS